MVDLTKAPTHEAPIQVFSACESTETGQVAPSPIGASSSPPHGCSGGIEGAGSGTMPIKLATFGLFKIEGPCPTMKFHPFSAAS